jgi:hypothetical protein
LSARRFPALLQIAGVAAIALVLGLALGSAVFSTTRTTTVVSTVQGSTQQTTLYFNAPSVTMPVPCCATIPQTFEVGNYLFNVTEYAPLPSITENGTVTVFSGGVLLIFNVSLMSNSSQHEEANFSWTGTFSETVPFPSSASLFAGNARIGWFVNSSILYIQIATGESVTTSTPSTSNEMACLSTRYSVLGLETLSVENGTTYTSSTVTTLSTQSSFTTTTVENESLGYVTTSSSYIPPSSWTITSCTFITPEPILTENETSATLTYGDWQFASTINGTVFKSGQTVDLNSTLTYLGNRNTTVRLTGPILVFQVLSPNGSLVYSWYPPQIIQSYNVTPGQSFNQPVNVVTQGWHSGVYKILIFPEIFLQSNLTLSFSVS